MNNNLICLIAILLLICILVSYDKVSIKNVNSESNNEANNEANNNPINAENSSQSKSLETPPSTGVENSQQLEEPNRFAKMFRANLDYLDVNDVVNFMQYDPKVNQIQREKENQLNGGYVHKNIVGYSNGGCYSGV